VIGQLQRRLSDNTQHHKRQIFAPQAGFHINGELSFMFSSSPTNYQSALRNISEERRALS